MDNMGCRSTSIHMSTAPVDTYTINMFFITHLFVYDNLHLSLPLLIMSVGKMQRGTCGMFLNSRSKSERIIQKTSKGSFFWVVLSLDWTGCLLLEVQVEPSSRTVHSTDFGTSRATTRYLCGDRKHIIKTMCTNNVH